MKGGELLRRQGQGGLGQASDVTEGAMDGAESLVVQALLVIAWLLSRRELKWRAGWKLCCIRQEAGQPCFARCATWKKWAQLMGDRAPMHTCTHVLPSTVAGRAAVSHSI